MDYGHNTELRERKRRWHHKHKQWSFNMFRTSRRANMYPMHALHISLSEQPQHQPTPAACKAASSQQAAPSKPAPSKQPAASRQHVRPPLPSTYKQASSQASSQQPACAPSKQPAASSQHVRPPLPSKQPAASSQHVRTHTYIPFGPQHA